MNVIWIAPEMPYPANTGGRIGIYKRLEYFGKINKIFFYCIVDSNEELKYKSKMEEVCEEVYLYNRKKHRLLNFIKSLYKGPYACVSRTNVDLRNDINDKIKKTKIDYVIVDFPQMLGNIDKSMFQRIKIVLNQHNTEYKALENLSHSLNNPLKRLVYNIESFKLRKWEEKYYRNFQFSLVTFVSAEDKAFFESKYGLLNTLLVPVGSQISSYRVQVPNSHTIAYFGKMEYPANAEAAIWYAQNVFVEVKKMIPDAKFYIVGKNPLQAVKELESTIDGVVVTGTVDSVDPYYEIARLVVIPLSHGSGVKVKLLEGIGKSALMISTSKGLEGTCFEPNVDLLVADGAEQMVAISINALLAPEQFEKVRRQGYEKVKSSFSWESIVMDFSKALETFL